MVLEEITALKSEDTVQQCKVKKQNFEFANKGRTKKYVFMEEDYIALWCTHVSYL